MRPGPGHRGRGSINGNGADEAGPACNRLPTYCCFFGAVLSDMPGFAGVLVDEELDPPVPALPEPALLPEPMLPEGAVVEPVAEPEALPLVPPLALPDAGGVTVTEPEVLDESGAAPGAELELLLELAGALGALGAVLEPLLDEDEVPGRVASLDFGLEDGPRSQPVAASAIATAAATSVK